MSMETHVFFRGKLPGKAALSRAMKELGFPFSIKPATGSLEAQSGFMPMLLRRDETGVEFDVFGDHAAVEEFADAGVDQSFERRASFRWGGDFEEAVAGMCAAAALAKLVNGVVFDEAEGKLLAVDDAVALAKRNLATLAEPKPAARMGTRPADIKRYLKPLLKQRSDLVLIGRLLIIRPVRHLLRGVFFDRTSDKYKFRVSRYIRPLFPVDEGCSYNRDIHRVSWQVWQPHFKELLSDALAEDIFEEVAQIRSLADFGRKLDLYYLEGQTRFQYTRVAALTLGGEREEAAGLVDRVERCCPTEQHRRHWANGQRSFLQRKTEDLCAEFRQRETEAAKAMALGDLWEPTPFPLEVPEGERSRRCDEPRFVTTPWVPRSPGLVQEVPQERGEIRFGQEELWRQGRSILLIPLTREQAEEKHRTRQNYVLATRLGESLLVLHHRTSWSPHDPEQPRNPHYVPRRSLRLEAYDAKGRLQVCFEEDLDRQGIVALQSITVFEPTCSDTVWYAFNHCGRREKTIHDHRTGGSGYSPRTLTESDLALCEFPEPPFGEFIDLVERTSTYLHNEGFGTWFDDDKRR
jgi:hypothetical protein